MAPILCSVCLGVLLFAGVLESDFVLGCAWVSLDVLGCAWLCSAVLGCAWVCLGVLGYACMCSQKSQQSSLRLAGTFIHECVCVMFLGVLSCS